MKLPLADSAVLYQAKIPAGAPALELDVMQDLVAAGVPAPASTTVPTSASEADMLGMVDQLRRNAAVATTRAHGSVLLAADVALGLCDGDEVLFAHLTAHPQNSRLSITALTLAELQSWAREDADDQKRRKDALDILLEHVQVLPFDERAARAIPALSTVRGVCQPSLLAAACAIAHRMQLVTATRSCVVGRGLHVEVWVRRPASRSCTSRACLEA